MRWQGLGLTEAERAHELHPLPAEVRERNKPMVVELGPSPGYRSVPRLLYARRSPSASALGGARGSAVKLDDDFMKASRRVSPPRSERIKRHLSLTKSSS